MVLIFSPDGNGVLRSNTSIGALRGLETFSQLVEYDAMGKVKLWQLPIFVRDEPRWKYRGLKVDTSRHFIPLTHLQNIIRGMEAAKLNVLQVADVFLMGKLTNSACIRVTKQNGSIKQQGDITSTSPPRTYFNRFIAVCPLAVARD